MRDVIIDVARLIALFAVVGLIVWFFIGTACAITYQDYLYYNPMLWPGVVFTLAISIHMLAWLAMLIIVEAAWALKTFGPGLRTDGLIDHIKKELVEIKAAPTDLVEWVDLIILAIDGATRAGHTGQQIADALHNKHIKNQTRAWPDWRTVDPNKAIEHIRSEK